MAALLLLGRKGSNSTPRSGRGSAGTSDEFESTMSFGSGFSRFQSPAPGKDSTPSPKAAAPPTAKAAVSPSAGAQPLFGASGAAFGKSSSASPNFAPADFGATLGRPPLAPRDGAGGGGGSSGFFNLSALGRKTTTAPRGGPPDDDAGATTDPPPSVTQLSDEGSGFASSGFDSAQNAATEIARSAPGASAASPAVPRKLAMTPALGGFGASPLGPSSESPFDAPGGANALADGASELFVGHASGGEQYAVTPMATDGDVAEPRGGDGGGAPAAGDGAQAAWLATADRDDDAENCCPSPPPGAVPPTPGFDLMLAGGGGARAQPTRVREVSFLGLRDNAPARPGAEAPRADQHTPVLAPPEQDVSPTGMCFRRELF